MIVEGYRIFRYKVSSYSSYPTRIIIISDSDNYLVRIEKLLYPTRIVVGYPRISIYRRYKYLVY